MNGLAQRLPQALYLGLSGLGSSFSGASPFVISVARLCALQLPPLLGLYVLVWVPRGELHACIKTVRVGIALVGRALRLPIHPRGVLGVLRRRVDSPAVGALKLAVC